jgi:large subunit ribosomal protein L18
MNSQKQKLKRQNQRRRRTRKRIQGHPDRPRVSVYRSLNHMYAQVIDDLSGKTLCSASTMDKSLSIEGSGNAAAAKAVGKAIAERAKAAGVTAVVFDRNGFPFHGRVRALAEGAREGGLQF